MCVFLGGGGGLTVDGVGALMTVIMRGVYCMKRAHVHTHGSQHIYRTELLGLRVLAAVVRVAQRFLLLGAEFQRLIRVCVGRDGCVWDCGLLSSGADGGGGPLQVVRPTCMEPPVS